jgi:beta-lactamase superfamily II metal-dependent hydrolase
LRYFYPDGRDFVAVIDGGYQEDGSKLADIVRCYYDRYFIDLVVSTHPDQDHISGLRTLIDEIAVGRVWVHQPLSHPQGISVSIAKAFDKYLRVSQSEVVVKSLDQQSDFIDAVDALGIKREEPLAGTNYGPLWVLGPSRQFYEQMLGELADSNGLSNAAKLMQLDEYFTDDFLEQHSQYAIDENNETTPINNTSTIIYLSDGNRVYLFTGDVGVQGLNDARRNYNFSNVHWLDVPHHGSRRNLTNEIVTYLNPTVAYVSATGNRKHPSRAVIEALKRVGTRLYSTHKSGSLWHHSGLRATNDRDGYITADPL